MNRKIIYIAKYSAMRMLFFFLVVYPLPIYLVVGSAIDMYFGGNFSGSFLFFILAMPLIFIFFDSIFTKEFIFFEDSVSKKYYVFGEINIKYADGYVIPPKGIAKILSSAFHIRERKSSFFHRIVYIELFFSNKTKIYIKNIITILTESSNDPIGCFISSKLQIGE